MMQSGVWLAKWRLIHMQALSVLTFAVSLLFLLKLEIPLSIQVIGLGIGVAFLGLPHGALDHLVARPFFSQIFGWYWPVPFVAIYLGITLLVLVGWLIMPVLTLVLFLIVSCIHFGLEDVESDLALPNLYWVEVVMRGAMPIVITSFFYSQQVSQIFVEIMPVAPELAMHNLVKELATILIAIQIPSLVLLIVIHLKNSTSNNRKRVILLLLELSTLCLLFAVAPPLVSFLLYFCGWHSLRHTLQLAVLLDEQNPKHGLKCFVLEALPLTLVVIVSGLITWFFMGTSTHAFNQTGIRIVFLILSALTFPHMAFRTLINKQQTSQKSIHRRRIPDPN